MGGIITRERRKRAPHKPLPRPKSRELSHEAAHSKASSRVDAVKTERPTLPFQKRVAAHDQGLTEEMMEDFTRSSTANADSKANKKSVTENWLLQASYKVSAENDALVVHQRSMEALAALQAQKDRSAHSESDQSRSNPKTRRTRSRQPPNVEVYSTVPTPA